MKNKDLDHVSPSRNVQFGKSEETYADNVAQQTKQQKLKNLIQQTYRSNSLKPETKKQSSEMASEDLYTSDENEAGTANN